jgi:ABC-2 type transport system ATP-binding protein
MDEADRCDELLFMRDGRVLAQGTPDALRKKAGTDNLETAFLQFAGVTVREPAMTAGDLAASGAAAEETSR